MRAPISGVSLGVSLGVWLLACGGADKPAPDKPVIKNEGGAANDGSEPRQAPCPTDAIEPVVGTVGDPPLADGDHRTAQIQACVAIAENQWLVIGSLGDHDPDTQSEEGWQIVRFVADGSGAVLARGPEDGASWMTGVPEGTYETADLDGDDVAEVLERIDIYVADPSQSTQIVRVYSRRGDRLVIPLEIVLADGDKADPEGGQVCRATFEITAEGDRRHVDVDVTKGPEVAEIETSDIVLEATDGRESVQCLPVGRFRFTYVDGVMTGAVRAATQAPKPSPGQAPKPSP